MSTAALKLARRRIPVAGRTDNYLHLSTSPYCYDYFDYLRGHRVDTTSLYCPSNSTSLAVLPSSRPSHVVCDSRQARQLWKRSSCGPIRRWQSSFRNHFPAASMNVVLLFLWHLSLCLHAAVASEQQADSNPKRPPPVNEAANNGSKGYYPTFTFVTEVELNAPVTNFMQWNERCNDGSLYFLTPRGWGIQNPGPMILDEQGNLIWAKHFANKFGGQAYDFMVQKYQGEDYLTFWLGDDRVRGHGSGFYYMVCSKSNQAAYLILTGAAQFFV